MVSAQEYYSKGQYRLIQSNTDVPLVSALDEKMLRDKYFKAFEIQGVTNLRWETGIEYNFCRVADTSFVSIRIGLYPSVREAEEAVLDGLNGGTAWMNEGPIQSEQIGDTIWYTTTETALHGEIIILVTFIRYNAVFTLCCMDGEVDLLSLAKSIDQDIQNGASYLKSNKTISPPVIRSVEAPKEIRELDRILFAVDASDPEGYGIKYHCLFGGQQSGQPENVLEVCANPNYFPNDPASGQHAFRIWVVNENNLFSSVSEVTVTFSVPSAVNEDDATAEVPEVFTLSQNTPNPFNPSTAIAFTLSRPEVVRLSVYDALGRTITNLASGNYSAGSHSVRWDGRDGRGNAVSSGVYLYRLEAGGKTEARKMLLAR